MRTSARPWVVIACGAWMAACSGGTGSRSSTEQASGGTPDGGLEAGIPDAGPADAGTPDAGVTLRPPFTKDGWTFYGAEQGLSTDVSDVSADEGGNVYVAGGDAVYVKKRDGQSFLRFDDGNAGITRNCYVANMSDPAQVSRALHPDPPGAPIMCPIISVAGAAPGVAMIGFRGMGTDGDDDAEWVQDSGGADLVAFDGAALTRTRHVLIGSPPHTICPSNGNEAHTYSCSYAYDWFWVMGRRKLRQVLRIVVNHDHRTAMYGDFFMGGTHASLTALLNDAAARGYPDRITGQPAKWGDAIGVWEHDHPAFYSASRNAFLTNEAHALAIDPFSGTPWCSNGYRTAYLTGGYGAWLGGDDWWLRPQTPPNALYYDFWPDSSVPTESLDNNVQSLSFCPDGTLWIGSYDHALARMAPGGSVSYVTLPDPALHGNSVEAVACDPSDGSIWIGLGWGGVMRLKGGAFTTLDPNDPSLPAFTHQSVRSIQIDAWSSPRIVYFAFEPTKDASGAITRGGGVAAYQGP
jgi:hypothetical protein